MKSPKFMDDPPTERQAAGVILFRKIKEELQVLLLHYRHGHWDYSKGHVEPEESLQQTALRELKEETGLIALLDKAFSYSYSYPVQYPNHPVQLKHVTLFLGWYACNADVCLSHEHVQAQWVNASQACDQLTYENSSKALVAALQYIAQ